MIKITDENLFLIDTKRDLFQFILYPLIRIKTLLILIKINFNEPPLRFANYIFSYVIFINFLIADISSLQWRCLILLQTSLILALMNSSCF